MALEDDLNDFADSFAAAVTESDADALTALYTADGVFMTHGMPAVAGRDELHAMFSDDSAPGTMTIRPGEVVLDAGEIVVDVGSYVTMNYDGTNERPGKYVGVYRREPDGTLRLAVHVPVRVV